MSHLCKDFNTVIYILYNYSGTHCTRKDNIKETLLQYSGSQSGVRLHGLVQFVCTSVYIALFSACAAFWLMAAHVKCAVSFDLRPSMYPYR